MNTRATYLPLHWQEWVKNHPNLSKGMLTPEFNNFIRLQFADGSFVFFNYAFCVIDEENDEIAVFTEHCGYHVFRLSIIDRYNTLAYAKPLNVKGDDGN